LFLQYRSKSLSDTTASSSESLKKVELKPEKEEDVTKRPRKTKKDKRQNSKENSESEK